MVRGSISGWASASSMAISRESVHFISMPFLDHVDGVFGNFDHEVAAVHARLTRQPRLRLQPPSLVEQIILFFGGRCQRIEAFPHDDMAGGAGAGFLAGVFDLDAVGEQGVADGFAWFGVDHGALWAEFDVGQYDELRHGFMFVRLRNTLKLPGRVGWAVLLTLRPRKEVGH